MEYNAITTIGNFTVGALEMELLDYADTEFEFEVNVNGSKDGIIALIDVPSSATGNHKLVCYGTNGFPDKTFSLNVGKLNVIHLTTLGYMHDDGNAWFNFISGSGVISELDIKAGFIKHVNVVNN